MSEHDLHMASGDGKTSYAKNSRLQVTLSLSLFLSLSLICMLRFFWHLPPLLMMNHVDFERARTVFVQTNVKTKKMSFAMVCIINVSHLFV
jgi:hypothetical protein